jgi:hypothetical protein
VRRGDVDVAYRCASNSRSNKDRSSTEAQQQQQQQQQLGGTGHCPMGCKKLIKTSGFFVLFELRI